MWRRKHRGIPSKVPRLRSCVTKRGILITLAVLGASLPKIERSFSRPQRRLQLITCHHQISHLSHSQYLPLATTVSYLSLWYIDSATVRTPSRGQTILA